MCEKVNEKIKKIIGTVLVLSVTAGLCAGCAKKAVTLPDVSALSEIDVVSREDGSGTRSEFESLTESKAEGTDEIAESTDQVLEMVSEDLNAIGYAAYSAIDTSDNVNVLAVDGVTAEEKTIKNGDYPLCRNYYLAYSGELTDVETDFLRYIRDKGQDIVEQYCIRVSEDKTFLSDQSAGDIVIHGSSSVSPIMEALAEDYMSLNKNAVITVETSDSGSGLTDAIEGKCDMAMSSRELEDYEEELLDSTVIGKDAIVVIVNKDNPVTDLSKDMLKRIYDNEFEKWGDIE